MGDFIAGFALGSILVGVVWLWSWLLHLPDPGKGGGDGDLQS